MQGIFAIVLIFILQCVSVTGVACAGDSVSFNPVPIAIEAHGAVPVGTIIAWPAVQNPDEMNKWLECNGQAVSQAKYPQLYAKVGGRTPNYYNQFLRGGTLAQVGQVVADSTRSHNHGQPAHTHSFNGRLVSGAISGTASAQSYTDMWTEIGYGGFPLKEGDLSELGHRVRDSSNRYTSGGTISGNISNTTVEGNLSLSGGDNTYQNTNSDGTTGGAETAPQHTRVRYLIRALP